MKGAADAPVSVAVPARDEEATLWPLLESLLAQSRAPAEILVADGGSRDGTVALAERHAAHGVRVLELGPAFPGRARNAALAAARSEWVALVDAGCVADAGWLEALTAAAGDGEVRAVFGNYEPVVRTEWEAAQALAVVAPADPTTGARSPSTASLLLHRSAWESAGRFREDLRAAEDLLFFEELDRAGVRTARAPTATVRWTLSPTPGAAFRRLRLYSRHHLAAGLARTWHRRVFMMDLLAAGLLLACFAWPWLAVPLVLGGLARLLRTVWLRRRNVPGSAFRPDRLLRVAVLLALADAAAWAGLLDRASGRSGP
jgi:glycosyltransferase involved in cell wall biosynthesis